MKVLYVINPKAEVDQWGRLGDTALTQYLIKGMSDKVDAYLVCGHPIGEDLSEKYEAKKAELGLKDIFYGFEYDPRKNLSQINYWFNYIRVLQMEHHFDVIHVHQAQVAASTSIAHFALNNPDTQFIWTLHNPPEGRATFQYSDSYKKILSLPNCKIVCVSNSARERLIQSMNITENLNRLDFIYNGIPIDRNVLEMPYRNMYDFIGVGRIDPPKNTEYLLQFMEYMYKNHDMRSAYIGSTFSTYTTDSDYVLRCNEIINRGVKEGWLSYYPEQDHEGVLHLMRYSRYYVNLSRVETFSLTSCESMYVETPVICFNEAGPGEIVPDKYGIKIEPVFRRSYSKYMKDLEEAILNDNYDRYNYDMSIYVQANFSTRAMSNNYYKLYKEMLEK